MGQDKTPTGSFILCVCGVRECGGVRQDPAKNSKNARRDGPQPNHRNHRLRHRYRTTTTVHYQSDKLEESILSLCEVGPIGVIA